MATISNEQGRPRRRWVPAEIEDRSGGSSSSSDVLDFCSLISKMRRIEEQSHEKRYGHQLQNTRAQLLINRAVNDVQRLIKESSLTKTETSGALAEFYVDEIDIGCLLGTGGFARVHEVSGFHPRTSSKEFSTRESQAAREFFVKHAIRESTGECRFAVKHLRQTLVYNPEKFASGVVDLAMEAHMLAALDHPNVLKIRGVASSGPRGILEGSFDDYFLIIDKLSETLEDRICTWAKRMKRLNRRRLCGNDKREVKRKQVLLEQLQVAHEISCALEYVHSMGIVHRDIKPSNIGFINGEVKLFDFGLAAEIRQDDDGLPCPLKENVGSRMFKAPEVEDSKDYDFAADVYSYAITFYEILSLTRPSEKSQAVKKNNNKKEELVSIVEEDTPPTVSPSWPVAIQVMLNRAWSPTSSDRPSMSEIREILYSEIQNLQGLDPSDPIKKHPAARRRSSVSSYLASLVELKAELEGKNSHKTHTTRCTQSVSFHQD